MASREEHRLEAEKLVETWKYPRNAQEALTLALVHAILSIGPERPSVPRTVLPGKGK